MNLSGQPVQMLAGFFKFKPEEILVVHDELDFDAVVLMTGVGREGPGAQQPDAGQHGQ